MLVQSVPPTGPGRVMSKADYARHRGCSAAYVSKVIREEKLRHPALRPDGRIDRVLADAQLAGSRERPPAEIPDSVEGGEGADDGSDSLVEHRKAVLREQQRKLARENEVDEGRLVDRAQAEEEQETAARATRDALLRVPHLVADRLARETDPVRVKVLLREAIERALLDAVQAHEEEAERPEDDDAGVGQGVGP